MPFSRKSMPQTAYHYTISMPISLHPTASELVPLHPRDTGRVRLTPSRCVPDRFSQPVVANLLVISCREALCLSSAETRRYQTAIEPERKAEISAAHQVRYGNERDARRATHRLSIFEAQRCAFSSELEHQREVRSESMRGLLIVCLSS